MEELNQQDQQQDASASSAMGEPAAATGQALSGQTTEPSSAAGATSEDVGQQDSSSESTGESQTAEDAGSTTGGDAPSDVGESAQTAAAEDGTATDHAATPESSQSNPVLGGDEPHPVRAYSDILRGKFQRLEAVALSDIEHLFDLIEEHL